jgi:long-chain acyl-CoA synthetase
MMVAVPRLLELLHNGIRQSIAARGPLLRGLFRGLLAVSALCARRCGRRLFPAVHRRFGGSLRRIATGGSALDPRLGRSFQLMGFEVSEGYGMTETSPVLSVNPWSEVRLGSVGRPLRGVDIEVLSPAGTASASEPPTGEIRVRGANVMAGYYRNEAASREVLRDGWLHTGDLGYLDRDGYLHVAGRGKDVIVTSAGKSVYPEEVERRYLGLAEVRELVVLGLSDDGYGDRVTAVVVPRPEATAEELERIRAAIAARSREVPSYQQISRIEFWRGDLPKTTTLKVQRNRLRDMLLAGASPPPRPTPQEPPALAPRSALESPASSDQTWILATLARLTRSREEALRAEDRLTELGMDSLTRVELVAELEGRFGLQVDDECVASLDRVQDLFDLVAPPASIQTTFDASPSA